MQCPDCKWDYTCTPAEHLIFCEARTCEVCLANFDQVLPLDAEGHRVCTRCENEMSAGAFDRDSEEDDDNGAT